MAIEYEIKGKFSLIQLKSVNMIVFATRFPGLLILFNSIGHYHCSYLIDLLASLKTTLMHNKSTFPFKTGIPNYLVF